LSVLLPVANAIVPCLTTSSDVIFIALFFTAATHEIRHDLLDSVFITTTKALDGDDFDNVTKIS